MLGSDGSLTERPSSADQERRATGWQRTSETGLWGPRLPCVPEDP